MKTRTLISLLLLGPILVGLLLVIWFLTRASHNPVASAAAGALSQGKSRPSVQVEEHRDNPIKDNELTDIEFKRMMESSVEFYGKVVDQDDRPMAGIEIRCSWNFMTSMDGLTVMSTAPDGRFEVKGMESMEMSFSVILPKGFRKTETSRQEFLFGDYPQRLQKAYEANGRPLPTKHLPDPENPVVFRIKKIGSADVLSKARQGSYSLPRDGSPRYFSLSEPSVNALDQPTAHSVEFSLVSEKEPDDNPMVQLDWSMKIRVKGGGLQPVKKEMNPITGDDDQLYAPEAGYQEEVTFEFPKSMPKWQRSIDKEFFFRFPDNRYGRATIRANARGVVIDSFFNPTGSRNLFLDETKVIELKNSL